MTSYSDGLATYFDQFYQEERKMSRDSGFFAFMEMADELIDNPPKLKETTND